MNNTIYYSIIIPHHNIPNLLQRLLDSIPVRSDTEVIVIDDGSSEDVVKKLKEFEKSYLNTRFIYSKESKGGGAARNIGIKKY